MYSVQGTSITLVRGDSAVLDIMLNVSENEPYTPEDGDKLSFAMKSKSSAPNDTNQPILVIDIPTDTMQLVIKPEHTKNLPCGEYNGHYKYDIKLIKADGFVDTVVPFSDLTLIESIG